MQARAEVNRRAHQRQAVPADVLTTIASAIRDHQRLRFDYQPIEGSPSLRSVEPHRLVHTRGRWYLVAWDPHRDDWRTFRADRITPRTHAGPTFKPRPDPGGDLVRYVEQGLGRAMWHYRARIRVHAPATEVTDRVPSAVIIEAIDERTGYANVGSDTPHQLVIWLAHLDHDFDAHDHPELAQQLRNLAKRYERAAG